MRAVSGCIGKHSFSRVSTSVASKSADEIEGRNLAFSLQANTGGAVLLVGYAALRLTFAIEAARAHQPLGLVAVFVVIWRPILAAIMWLTNRALRNQHYSFKQNHPHHQGHRTKLNIDTPESGP